MYGVKTPEVWSAPTIILLDVGMSTQLTEHERQRMVDLFRSFSRLDGAAMARTTLTFSPEQSCSDPQVRPSLQTTLEEINISKKKCYIHEYIATPPPSSPLPLFPP